MSCASHGPMLEPQDPQENPSPRKRRLLVTGAAGFIGAALCQRLLDSGWSVCGLDNFSSGWPERLPHEADFDFIEADVGEPGGLRRLLEGGGFEAVVHLAARVGVRAVLRDPEGCRASNLRGIHELIEAIRALPQARRPRLLAASSSEVYDHSGAPLAEGDPTRPTSGAGRWAYAASKLRGEELLDEAQLWPAERGPVHLRFFNVVGPGQDADSGMVLPTFIESAVQGLPIPVHGDGTQVRTFAHVEEVARTLCELLEHRALPAGALNVGGSARTSIKALAALLRSSTGAACEVSLTDPRSRCGANFEDVSFREPDLRRLSALGVSVPSMSLAEIVRTSVARHFELRRPQRVTANKPLGSCVSPAS